MASPISSSSDPQTRIKQEYSKRRRNNDARAASSSPPVKYPRPRRIRMPGDTGSTTATDDDSRGVGISNRCVVLRGFVVGDVFGDGDFQALKSAFVHSTYCQPYR